MQLSRFCASGFWLLNRLRLYRSRLLRCSVTGGCAWLLYRLSLRPLLLLLLLLNLSLGAGAAVAAFADCLRRRLFIPRHFVQLRRLLAHIGLHLCQQLALFVRVS